MKDGKGMKTAISLFCGAGGCSLGFEQANYKILMATDFDKAAIETYKLNFPETDTLLEDINNINFVDILNKYNMNAGDLDFLIGGPPCQGFSTAGTRFWDDPRNHLLKSYIRAISVLKPKWFMMENVEGLLTSNKGIYLVETINALINLGYKIRVEKIYCQEFDVPQRRKRVIILGNSLGIDFSMPEPTSRITGPIFRNSNVTLSSAISSLPEATTIKDGVVYSSSVMEANNSELCLGTETEQITEHFYKPLDGIQLERVSALSAGQTMKDLPEHLQHDSFKKRANRRVSDGTPSNKRGGAPSGIKRLHADEPCLTITGSATRELIHPKYDRPLTIREAARIQTFPDSFKFYGNSSQKIKQIGNAIPPVLAKTIGLYIKNTYGFERKEDNTEGALLGFVLTKAEAMSPALKKTDQLLQNIINQQKNIISE